MLAKRQNYFIYDDLVAKDRRLGGVDIKERDGLKYVDMTEVEARYFVDQGTIGLKQPEKRTEKAKAVTQQLVGDAPPKDVRTSEPASAPAPKKR